MEDLDILTAEQAAAKLQIHPKTVKRLLAQGKLPGKKIGSQWRISAGALQRYVEEGTSPKGGDK